MLERLLEGRRLLVVEDEYFIATDLVATLESAGARVYGPVSDVERAIEVVCASAIELDGAVLDINLNGEMVYPAAALLTERGVPFVFVTGYDCSSMPKEFTNAHCLRKPFEEKDLVAILAALPESEAVGRRSFSPSGANDAADC